MPLTHDILFILGMHRSGTSFLAECCGVLGHALPQDAGGPAADNPRGHFEPAGVVALNDDILAQGGAIWARVGRPEPVPVDAALLARLDAAVQASYPDGARALLKDPRLSLLMPVWRAWTEDRGIRAAALIALRDPRAVAQSLGRRDGLTPDLAMLSWMTHTLEAVAGTEGLPRMLVPFPDWTEAVAPTLNRIAALVGVTPPAQAVAHVAEVFLPEAVHGRGDVAAEGPAAEAALALFDELRAAAQAGQVPPAAALTRHRERLDSLSALARAVEAAHAPVHMDARARLATLERRRAGLEADLAARLADAAALQDRIAATEAQRDEIERAAARRLAATEAQRDEIAHAAARRLAATEAQRDEMTAIADERLTRIGALTERLADADARLTQADRMLTDALARPQVERPGVLSPVYRRLYRLGGRGLRGILPASVVDGIKRRLPVPGSRVDAVVPAATSAEAAPAPRPDVAPGPAIPPRTGDKPDIFVLSIINWEFRTQRPQHLAIRMAAAGHRVFYVEMERTAGEALIHPREPGVSLVRLPDAGMTGLPIYNGVPTAAQARAWVGHFHDLARAVDASPVAHVVIEHPYWWHLARHLSPEFQIAFDCMDDIGGFSNTAPHVLEAELELIAAADKMIVSSQYLYDKFSPLREVALVRNGTDVTHFIREPEDEPAPGFLRGKLRDGAIRVGYVGAIDTWFDDDLLEAVARDNPDFDIHLCGHVTAEAPRRLAEIANVTLHGEISYMDVPAFNKQMDVLIIPFRLLPIIQACDPVKFYEYSAVMRPTVSTMLPELERAGDLVFRAATAAEFADQIRRAAPLARDAAFGRRLRRYALDNAWSFRAADMLAELKREPKLSVVILHYGEDVELTLASLHALLGRGEVYPNLEIVLVDNGSSDAVLSALRARAAADARIVLIENGENLGFARGNNRGIAAATGEYVALLNNDTFLAPGALLAMVRHLQRNPEIGIVGPMTNNIGNEARVEIAYADMDQMVRAARDLTTGHRGQWTPMAVCAYFCAMFRRADLDRLGHLPEIYGRGMFEDDDHCATFRAAGLQMALAEDAFCHHHLSATFDALPSGEKQALFARNKALFEERWGPWTPHAYRNGRPTPTLPAG